jgi:hypothetical protein
MSDPIFYFFYYITILSCGLPLLYLMYKWKKTKLNWILFAYFLLACATELASWIIIMQYHMYNIIVINLYNIPLIIIIAILYSHLLDKKMNKLIFSWLILFVVIFGYLMIFHPIFYTTYTLPYILISIGTIFLAVYYLFRYLMKPERKKVLRDGRFLVNFVIFFYFANTFYLSLFEYLVYFNNWLHSQLWPIQLFTTILANLMFVYSIYWLKKEDKLAEDQISKSNV